MSETTSKKEINMVNVPVLAISERPLFPETLTTLMIARPEDVKAVNYAIEKNDGIFAAFLKDKDEGKVRKIGTLVKI